jgi:hypothetical protein
LEPNWLADVSFSPMGDYQVGKKQRPRFGKSRRAGGDAKFVARQWVNPPRFSPDGELLAPQAATVPGRDWPRHSPVYRLRHRINQRCCLSPDGRLFQRRGEWSGACLGCRHQAGSLAGNDSFWPSRLPASVRMVGESRRPSIPQRPRLKRWCEKWHRLSPHLCA